jgi:hypothetical protein
MCPLSWARTYVMFLMVSYVAIRWPLNRQGVRCMPDASNPCPHSHVKRLNVEGWIKPRQKCNVEVKVKCVMWNEWIDGLAINHRPTPLAWTIMNVGSRCWRNGIILQNRLKGGVVMDVHQRCRLGVLITPKLSKERCIFQATKGRLFQIARRHD